MTSPRKFRPRPFFLLITGVPTVETAIAAVNCGADRYVIKDHELVDQLRRAVQRSGRDAALEERGRLPAPRTAPLTGLDNIIGQSPKMRAIFDLIQTVAPQSSRVLITGESGTGKELVARAIHENSARAQAPFITINCGAFPETLLESELFGYMKGAFTGANENRQRLVSGGARRHAVHGRDRQHEPHHAGEALSRAAGRQSPPAGQHGRDRRGRARDRRDQQGPRKGNRRGTVPRGPFLPPERDSDSCAGAARTARRHSAAGARISGALPQVMEKPIEGIEPEAMRRLEAYEWPGNVRELENTIERAVALETTRRFPCACFRSHRRICPAGAAVAGMVTAISGEGVDFEKEIAEAERRYLQARWRNRTGCGPRRRIS